MRKREKNVRGEIREGSRSWINRTLISHDTEYEIFLKSKRCSKLRENTPYSEGFLTVSGLKRGYLGTKQRQKALHDSLSLSSPTPTHTYLELPRVKRR